MSVPTSKSKEKQGLHFSSLFLQLVYECHCLDLTVPGCWYFCLCRHATVVKKNVLLMFCSCRVPNGHPTHKLVATVCMLLYILREIMELCWHTIPRIQGQLATSYALILQQVVRDNYCCFPSITLLFFLPPSFLPILTLPQKMLPDKYTVTTPGLSQTLSNSDCTLAYAPVSKRLVSARLIRNCLVAQHY